MWVNPKVRQVELRTVVEGLSTLESLAISALSMASARPSISPRGVCVNVEKAVAFDST
jgi:hypothetical protein